MKSLALLILLMLSLSLYSCNDRLPFHTKDAFIDIYNNSGKDVYYKISKNYPDTSVGSSENIYPITVKNGHVSPGLGTVSHEDFFLETHQGIICIFFFDADTVNKYGKEVVANQYKILIRKDFSYQKLKDDNFTVSYP